jgi:hypothetical protein
MRRGGQRIKGRAFEQLIVRTLTKALPGTVWHRSSQADRAWDADVVCESGNAIAQRLWLELCHAKHVDVRDKLEQGERDAAKSDRAMTANADVPSRLPAVVWRKSGAKHVNVTMRLATLIQIAHRLPGHYEPVATRGNGVLVTMELGEFLELVK